MKWPTLEGGGLPNHHPTANSQRRVGHEPLRQSEDVEEAIDPTTKLRDDDFPEPHIRRHPGLIRLSIAIGGSVALWGGLYGVGVVVASLIHRTVAGGRT
jgi:hypothetical protein